VATTGRHDLIVVKCGGSDDIDPVRICADLAAQRAAGTTVVLVHGGGTEVDRLARQMGVAVGTVRAPDGATGRHTDAGMLDVLTLAMTGRVKPRLLAALSASGVPAIGLTGLDAGLVRAVRKGPARTVRDGRVQIVHDDHSGRITHVDAPVLRVLLDAGLVPVLSPPAADERGLPLNVDADRIAAAVAGALTADLLILLTGAAGVLADPRDDTSALSECALPEHGPVGHGAEGGMRRKLIAAREALRAGVAGVAVADGRVDRPLTAVLHGRGTRVRLARPAPGDRPLSPDRSR
jgi:[amino group carrier protein]-L-2-aminoadipate 6-kinase